MMTRFRRQRSLGVLLGAALSAVLAGCTGDPPANLEIEDLVAGTGAAAGVRDMLTVHYTGTLANGTKFDSSYDRNAPFTFQLGVGDVIRGWDDGLVGMRVGGKRRLTIPPHLAYGEQGRPPVIPPNATLRFEVDLLSVVKP